MSWPPVSSNNSTYFSSSSPCTFHSFISIISLSPISPFPFSPLSPFPLTLPVPLPSAVLSFLSWPLPSSSPFSWIWYQSLVYASTFIVNTAKRECFLSNALYSYFVFFSYLVCAHTTCMPYSNPIPLVSILTLTVLHAMHGSLLSTNYTFPKSWMWSPKRNFMTAVVHISLTTICQQTMTSSQSVAIQTTHLINLHLPTLFLTLFIQFDHSSLLLNWMIIFNLPSDLVHPRHAHGPPLVFFLSRLTVSWQDLSFWS